MSSVDLLKAKYRGLRGFLNGARATTLGGHGGAGVGTWRRDVVRDFQKRDQPVIFVDTKKKELVGDFKNPGREWRPKDHTETVRVHDFVDPRLGKVIPLPTVALGVS